MAKLSGTVHKNDLEGGIWELHTADGKAYQLRGGDAALRVDGQAVEVDGAVDSSGFGIGMTGPIFDVKRWKPRA